MFYQLSYERTEAYSVGIEPTPSIKSRCTPMRQLVVYWWATKFVARASSYRRSLRTPSGARTRDLAVATRSHHVLRTGSRCLVGCKND